MLCFSNLKPYLKPANVHLNTQPNLVPECFAQACSFSDAQLTLSALSADKGD